jgi:ribonucleotide reductase beta subunit family protein with ferritin-like domain
MSKRSKARVFDPIIMEGEDEFDKFVLGDIENADAFDMYKRALACFWVAESIDFASDYNTFVSLKEDEKGFLLKVLAFFAGSDGIVLENVICRFYSEVKQAEVRLFYGLQIAMENIHSEVYTQMIQVFEKDMIKRQELFKSISKSPGVRAKAVWADTWLKSSLPFNQRLVAFACVEGILFSASFASIFYFRKRGIRLNGLFQSNDYICRDEALHCRFAVLLHSQLKQKVSTERILEIVKSSVEVEKIFIRDALENPILGMNAALMIQYVEFVADGLLQMLGIPVHFKSKNPFPFMDAISLEGKNNFFEKRVTEYSLSHVKVGGDTTTKMSSEKQEKIENGWVLQFSEEF